MNKILFGFILSILLSGFCIEALGQVNQIQSANHIIEESGVVENDSKVNYRLNKTIFEPEQLKKYQKFRFSFSPSDTRTLVVRNVKKYRPGSISIQAYQQNAPSKQLIATYLEGRLRGIFYDEIGTHIHLDYDVISNQNIIVRGKRSSQDHVQCGVLDHDNQFDSMPAAKFANDTKKQKWNQSSQTLSNYISTPLYTSEEDSITIDLMLVYTQAAEDWAASSGYGDIDGVIAQAMNLSQAALDNSKTGIELRLVHVHKTDYDETSDEVNSTTRLYRLTQNPDAPIFDDPIYDGHMEEVHDLRDQYGADIVSLLADINDTGGLGWRIGSVAGAPYFGFNLNRVRQVASGYTLIHEIGHNMGNSHSRTQNSNAAGDFGGLFHYSAGYQDTDAGFHTVMAYSDGLTQAPIFSSPDINWSGVPAGSNDAFTPENNILSMKQIKRSISNYRPTIQDAPVANASVNNIAVEIEQGSQQSVPLTISNSGNSALVWNVDFEFPGVMKSLRHQNYKQGISKKYDVSERETPDNFSQAPKKSKVLNEEILYSTSFEAGDNFVAGNFKAQQSWRMSGDSEANISTVNPSNGSQHLSIESDGTGDYKYFSAPFFGYQLFGSYELSFDIALMGSGFENQELYIDIYDGKNGQASAGILFYDGDFYLAELNESNEVLYYSTGTQVNGNQYHSIRILFNVANQTVDYYFDDVLVAEKPYMNGFTPGEIWFDFANSISGTRVDFDNIELRNTSAPYPWLNLDKSSDVTFEGTGNTINLTFNADGLNPGTYETILQVRTNDPQNTLLEIPVQLIVTESVKAPEFSMNEQINVFAYDSVSFPLLLTKMGTTGINSFDITFSYDPLILDLSMGNLSETLSGNFQIETDSTVEGELNVSGSGSTPISTEGTFLELQARGKSVGQSNVTITELRLNDSSVDTTLFSTILVNDRLCGDVTGNGSVTSQDATHILRHTVFMEPEYPIMGTDSMAADVTANGQITAYDASQILRYQVDLIDDLSCNSSMPKVDISGYKIAWNFEHSSVNRLNVTFDFSYMQEEMYAGTILLNIPEDATLEGITNLPEDWIYQKNRKGEALIISLVGSSIFSEKQMTLSFTGTSEIQKDQVTGHIQINESEQQLLTHSEKNELPKKFSLKQNYPNPFNPATTISFEIPESGHIKLSVFDALGREVATLFDEHITAGTYSVPFEAADLSTGIYFYRLSSARFTQVRKMLLLK